MIKLFNTSPIPRVYNGGYPNLNKHREEDSLWH